MTFIDDDEIEKVGTVLPEHIGAGGGQRLVDSEIHIPALTGVAASNLVPSVAKGCEHLGHRVVNQDVAVSQKQNLRSAVLSGPVPAAVPQLPADLESDAGLAGASGQGG